MPQADEATRRFQARRLQQILWVLLVAVSVIALQNLWVGVWHTVALLLATDGALLLALRCARRGQVEYASLLMLWTLTVLLTGCDQLQQAFIDRQVKKVNENNFFEDVGDGIKVVLSSVLPVSAYPWRPGLQPAASVRALNAALKRYAEQQRLVYLDYHAALGNADGGLDTALAEDGVHPTPAGYAKMAPLAEAAVAAALAH